MRKLFTMPILLCAMGVYLITPAIAGVSNSNANKAKSVNQETQISTSNTPLMGNSIASRDFEAYANNDWIGVVDQEWSTWGGSTGSFANGDAQVSTTFAKSGSNSLKLENASTDALFLMGDSTAGQHVCGFSIYVPSGSSGYYNIQETEVAGTRWVVEVFFDNGGTGTVEFGTTVFSFSYPQDQWVDVRNYCDLDNNAISVWIGGAEIGNETYTHNGGTTTLGSFDFYPDGSGGPSKVHYIDDMVYMNNTPIPVVSRDFELYANNEWIAAEDDEWSTWGGGTGSFANGDAQVSTAFAQSGTNSIKLENASTDALFLMGDKITGTWGNGFSMYVPTGSSGYYNIQETEVAGTRWVVEVFMDNGGTGTVEFGSNVIPFSYPHDTWFDVRHYCDLDNDSIQVWIDGNYVGASSYTHNGGTNKLGSFDFYPDGASGPSKVHYIDDMYFAPDSIRNTGPAVSRDFEAHTAGDWVGDVNAEFSTWGGSTGSFANGDAVVSSDFAQSGSNSIKLENASTDALFLMGDQTTGTWGNGFSMYVATGSSGYYNIQETEVAGTRWVVEVFMDNGGTGTVEFGSNVIPFTYPHDTWFDVRQYCDLDNDSIQVWIDGNFVGATSYTHNGGNTTLGSFDFYPDGASGPSKIHYVDDMYFQPDSLRAIGPVQSRNFEAHNTGNWVGDVNSEWSTWGGSTGSFANGDAVISNEEALSGTKSVKLENASTDALFLMGDMTTGTWGNGFHMFVPSGSSGYYNIQETEVAGTRWVVEIFMDNGGTGTVEFGSNVISFTYPQDTWFPVRHYCDLDNDSIQVWIDNNYVGADAYTHNGGTTTLGSFDFYPDGASGPSKVHYIDNMYYAPDSIRQVVALKNDIVRNNVKMYPNPATNKLIIDMNSDFVNSIEISDMVGQRVRIYNNISNRNEFDISELKDGLYLVRFIGEKGEYTEKLLVR